MNLPPEILPDLVSGLITFAGTIIAAFIGQQFVSRRKLQEKLKEAQADIAFLLEVEALHCEKHKLAGHSSSKLRIREQARARGQAWSGRFTPGRVRGNAGGAKPKRSLLTRIVERLTSGTGTSTKQVNPKEA
jgi:hypothetical protein